MSSVSQQGFKLSLFLQNKYFSVFSLLQFVQITCWFIRVLTFIPKCISISN